MRLITVIASQILSAPLIVHLDSTLMTLSPVRTVLRDVTHVTMELHATLVKTICAWFVIHAMECVPTNSVKPTPSGMKIPAHVSVYLPSISTLQLTIAATSTASGAAMLLYVMSASPAGMDQSVQTFAI